MATSLIVCPRCSKPFECGIATGSCWCADIETAPSVRAALAEYYDGCLCSECLQSIEAERPAVPSVWQFLRGQLKRKRRRARARH
jgi:hypothetical protein